MQSVFDRTQFKADTYPYLLGLRRHVTALICFVGIHETQAATVTFPVFSRALWLFWLGETMCLSHSNFYFCA